MSSHKNKYMALKGVETSHTSTLIQSYFAIWDTIYIIEYV